MIGQFVLKCIPLIYSIYGFRVTVEQTTSCLENVKEDINMARIYFCDPDGAEVDCPDCGSDAIVNDDGLVCSNPDCPNS